MGNKLKAVLTAILFVSAFSLYASAQNPSNQEKPVIKFGEHDAAKDRLIVGFKKGVTKSQKNSVHGGMKAKSVKSFKIINADVVDLPAGTDLKRAIAEYKKNKDVAYAEPDYVITIGHTPSSPPVTPDDPRFEELWGLHNTGQSGGTVDVDIDAPEAWDITTGSSSVVVAVIDTGIDYNHPDLAANMWINTAERDGTPGVDDDSNGFVDDIYGYDFRNNDGNPFDDNDHGTHCAGTIGALGNNGVGVVGVNHTVRLMALKFLSSYGSGYTSDAIECIEYAILMGADILSNSWGSYSYVQSLKDAIEAFGGVVVCAAGNDGINTDVSPHYPSSYDSTNIVSVTAFDRYDNQYYNYGIISVDIGAPGRSILSTTPGNTYQTWNGTSMATPHVAGVAALIKAEYPSATTSEIIDYTLSGAVPTASLIGKCLTGGRLNAYNALTTGSAGTGSLCVTIEPAEAVAAGAQWRRVGTSTWRNSGYTENDVAAGTKYIEFKRIADWHGPNPTAVTINDGETTNHTATYNLTWPGPDIYGYTGESTTGGFEDISTTGTAITFSDDDDGETNIPIGFDFNYYGTNYSTVRVGINGALTFTDSNISWINIEIPSPSAPGNLVAPFWDDLIIEYDEYTDGFIVYQVNGSEPYKRLIIQWRAYQYGLEHLGTVEFQVKLYQTTGDIEFCYNDVYFGLSNYDQGKDATMGIQKGAGETGLQYGFNGSRILNDGQKIRFSLPLASGSLQVNIAPQGAVDAGAQWRRVGAETWLAGGSTEPDILIGAYEVEFKDITGWDKPANQTVAIYESVTTTASGAYTQTGSLQVAITPQAAIDAGARWRRVGTSTWLESGYTESGILVGSVTIEYKDLDGWNKPINETVDIAFHETTATGGAYIRHTGSLTVTITPQGAIDVGAMWRRTGTSTWLESGSTETDIPTGGYTVEYRTVAGFAKPSNQAVTINYNETATSSGGYTQFTLSLTASETAGLPGENVVINVNLSNGAGVRAFGFDLGFDTSYLEYQAPAARGALVPAGFTFESNLIGGNSVRIGAHSDDGESTLYSGANSLASITFKIKADAPVGTTTTLTLANVVDDISNSVTTNGGVEVIDCVDNYDVNQDGEVTPGDALLAFQHYLGLIEITDPCGLLRADANGDGSVTPGDALIIFREYLGLN